MTTLTTHYAFIQPVNGGSLNTWGLNLNTDLSSIDTYIWAASQGTTIGVNAPAASATNITLTNPLNNVQQIAFSAGGQSLILPPMNVVSSMVVGGTLTVTNVGSNTFSILAQDASTVVLASLTAGSTAYLTVTNVVTANGTFSVVSPLTTVGVVPVASGGTGLTAGTSGGILAYTASGTLASSAALTANKPVIGGGAGVAPTVGTTSGNTTEFATVTGAVTDAHMAVWDVSGNLKDGGAPLTGTLSGNTTEFATVSSVGASTHLATWDANGNLQDGGAASTAGMVFLGAATASSSASVSFTNQITSTYNDYLVVWDSVAPATNNSALSMRLSTDGGSTYLSSGLYWICFGSTVSSYSTNTGWWDLCDSVTHKLTNSSGCTSSGQLRFGNVNSTTNVQMAGQHTYWENSTGIVGVTTTGGAIITAAINAIKFQFDSGNIATGNFYLYGLRKS